MGEDIESEGSEARPTIGDYREQGDMLQIFTPAGWVEFDPSAHMADHVESDIVELTPMTSTVLYHAWYAEQSRIRHEKEFWVGQAERDLANRELWRRKAIDLGVPETQTDNYIFSGPWDGDV